MRGLRIVDPLVSPAELELAAGLHALGQMSDRELDALRLGEATLVQHEGRMRVVPRVAGGAIGSGAVYERNLPAPGTFTINPAEFAMRTSKNRTSQAPIPHPGFGSSWTQRIAATGIVARLFIMFEGTQTGVGGAAAGTRQYPWNLLKRLRVSANGINNLFNCEGLDLRALMRIRRSYLWQDRHSLFVLPTGAANAQTLKLVWEVPLAYNEDLIGAIFAQTEETYLEVAVDTPTSGELYSANVPTFTNSTWRIMVEYFSIPSVDSKAGRVLVLPDITQLHGVITKDDPLTAVGEHLAPLTRTGGILLRVLQRFDNTDAGNVDIAADVDSHGFKYSGNVEPLRYAPSELALWQNELDYGDRILPAADVVAAGSPPEYVVDDFVRASAVRDVIHMLGITEATMTNQLRAGMTINAGAKVHTVQEAMVAS